MAELAYELDQTHGLRYIGSYSANWGGAGEKWMLGNGNREYFITPNGTLYQWTGARPGSGFVSGSTRVATLDATFYADPARLHDAPLPVGEDVGGSTVELIGGNIIRVTPGDGFLGNLSVNVTATDGRNSLEDRFTVSVIDHAPELDLADRSLSFNQDSLSIPLPARDADGDLVSYTVDLAVGNPLAELAWQLDQTHGLRYIGSYSTNWGGAGEKWMLGNGNREYFITPNGSLYQWTGARPGTGFVSGSTRLATLDASFHADPAKLHDAPPPVGGDVGGTTVELIDGNVIVLTPGDGFLGNLSINVTATDGRNSAEDGFVVSVIDHAPELALSNISIPRSQDSLTLNLPSVDADGQTVTYTAELRTGDPLAELAYEFDQTHGLRYIGSYSTNWGGAGEKWMLGNGNREYFITPNGTLYQW
ncbi:MAG: hypothetical protein KY476_25270, partial [Planctomycetes bacterium]|nr:hypothetical protein [Planctomycetota bacterium]